LNRSRDDALPDSGIFLPKIRGAWSKEVEKSFRDSDEAVKKILESRSRDNEQVIARQKGLGKKLETIFKERRVLIKI